MEWDMGITKGFRLAETLLKIPTPVNGTHHSRRQSSDEMSV